MPKLKKTESIPDLRSLGLATSARYIHNFIDAHTKPEICKLCSTPLPIQGCQVMKQINKLLNIPSNIADIIFTQVREDIYENRTPNGERLVYLLYNLFESSTFQIQHLSLMNPSDLHFVEKFGKYVYTFLLWLPRSDCKIYPDWGLVFKNLQNIRILNMASEKLEDGVLAAIGKECCQLQIIRDINLPRIADPTPLLKLCYKDGQLGVKNKCCDTLEVIDITNCNKNLSSHVRIEHHMTWDKVLTTLFTEVKHLKSLGGIFNIDEVFKFPLLLQMETGITDVESRNLSKGAIKLMKTFCPRLEKLKLTDQKDIEPLQDLHSFPFLKVISITNDLSACDTIDACLYEGILVAKMDSIIELDFRERLINLDINVLAMNLPKLAIFKCGECSEITWDGVTSFQSMDVFEIRRNSVSNLSWFSSFAKTIRRLKFCYGEDQELTDDVRRNILAMRFPCLKYFAFEYPNPQDDFDFLKDLITSCPVLNRFEGRFNRNDDIVVRLQEYLDKMNFECTVHWSDWWYRRPAWAQ